MITQEKAFQYAEALQEFTSAGGRIEKICACNDRKQVIRRTFMIMEVPIQEVTEEQIDEAIAKSEETKADLEAQKEKVIEEQGKIEA